MGTRERLEREMHRRGLPVNLHLTVEPECRSLGRALEAVAFAVELVSNGDYVAENLHSAGLMLVYEADSDFLLRCTQVAGEMLRHPPLLPVKPDMLE